MLFCCLRCDVFIRLLCLLCFLLRELSLPFLTLTERKNIVENALGNYFNLMLRNTAVVEQFLFSAQ